METDAARTPRPVATKALTWINCGRPNAYVVDTEGTLRPLEGTVHPALGSPDEELDPVPTETRLASGERLILVTDGVVERRTRDGGRFGADGLRAAIANAGPGTQRRPRWPSSAR